MLTEAQPKLNSRPCTSAGLVLYLEEIAEEGRDQGGMLHGQEAVTILTWHKAKGLEWSVMLV